MTCISAGILAILLTQHDYENEVLSPAGRTKHFVDVKEVSHFQSAVFFYPFNSNS